jgi:hypothetical protein
MVIVLLILTAIAASAQPTGDGVPLLRQVSEAARSAKGWRAEGGRDVRVEGPRGSPLFFEGRGFTVSMRGLLESHHDLGSGLTVCDGSTRWNQLRSFGGQVWESREVATAETCRPPAPRWGALLDSLRSAVILGTDDSRGCVLVGARYDLPDGLGFYIPTAPPVGLITREMCVDEARNMILWERLEGTSASLNRVIVSMTYKEVERDPEFGPDEFKIPPADFSYRDAQPDGVDLLQELDSLPVHFCSSPSGGCAKNPFALHNRN